MQKFLIILLGAVSLALLVGVLWPFETRLNEKDIHRITAVIREQTSEPILSIRPLAQWRVQVETGSIQGRYPVEVISSIFGGSLEDGVSMRKAFGLVESIRVVLLLIPESWQSLGRRR